MTDIDIAIMPASDIKFALRLPVELDAVLRKRAEDECQSLNTAIVEILRSGLSGGTGPARTARIATTPQSSVTADVESGSRGSGSIEPTKIERSKKFQKEHKIETAPGVSEEMHKLISNLPPTQILIPGEKCSQCSCTVYAVKHPDTGAVRWKCTGIPVHTMTPRAPKEAQ